MADDRFLETADRIGAQLCRDALWAGSRCNWLGPTMEPVDGSWQVVQRVFGPDLYSGTSGIAWFLTRLYALTGERLFRLTARGAAAQAWSRREDVPLPARLSFYSGWIGIAYGRVMLGETLEDDALVREGLDLLVALDPADLPEQGLDVLGGYAGAIAPLLALHGCYGRDALLDHARACGERLLQAAQRRPEGWMWLTMGPPLQPDAPGMLGFSHGAGGIAWALLELAHATGEERFAKAAARGVAYERHWFHPPSMNWPDFRSFYDAARGDERGPGFMLAWCHGAPGIGLARLRAEALNADEEVRQEAEVAVQVTAGSLRQTITQGAPYNFSLCHGLAGNAELLLDAGRRWAQPAYRALAEQVGHFGIEQVHEPRAPWPCGVAGAGETPGLMLGLAGIGHFYLRLHDPDGVPSVLIVTPRAAGPAP